MALTKKQQITNTLSNFYHNPVAMVSLELFLSIGAVLFFALFAIRPTLLTMSDLIKEIEDKKELDQQLTRKIAALSTVQSEYLQLQPELPVLDEAIPNSPYLIRSLKIIEKLASDQGLVIESITLPEIPDETELVPSSEKIDRNDIAVGVSITGQYPEIRQFVEDLRNSRRSFVIESVVFSTEEERGSKKLQTNLTLSMPYFTERTGTAAKTKK